jgi:hypothetical protein
MTHETSNTRARWSAHLLSVSGLPAERDAAPPPSALRAARPGVESLDLRLWRCTGEPGLPVPPELLEAGEGPLRPRLSDGPIEVWTEVELSSLHALWRLARLRADPRLRDRALAAMRWHLEHTQPDNATNRPWALHAFLQEGSAEGEAYAGTLLHNALAHGGRPEPLSAWILMDAAVELDARHPGAVAG